MQFHAVYTRPRKEFQARNEIKDLGFETYLPTQTRSVVIRRKRVSLHEPLFSRYLFVELDTSELTYGAINHCRSVEYMLEINGSPAPIPRAKIEILKMAERAGSFDFTKKTKFAVGDSVEITEGPFAGVIAKVQSASPRKRVKILMNFLCGEIATDIDDTHIRKLDPRTCNTAEIR